MAYEYKGIKIEWIGHASFRIRNEKVIYIDPYAEGEYSEPADIVLVTHEHFDHCAPEKIKLILKPETKIIAPEEAAKKLSNLGVEIIRIKPGEEIEIDNTKIKAVHAYNIGKPFHPKGRGVGYIVEISGVRIYHAGDTDVIPEMREIDVDIALLPIGGTYTMDEEEAVKALDLIKTKIVIPMHYSYLEGLEKDPHHFKELVGEKAQVIILG